MVFSRFTLVKVGPKVVYWKAGQKEMFEGTTRCIVLSLIYFFTHLPRFFTLILNT